MPDQWNVEWHDYYEILQISVSAEAEVVKAAHRTLAKKYHPDARAADLEKMKLINLSHEVLINPATRSRYDKIRQERNNQRNLEVKRISEELQRAQSERRTLEQKVIVLEKDIVSANLREQEARQRVIDLENELVSAKKSKGGWRSVSQALNSMPHTRTSPIPSTPAPSLPVVTAGAWRLPLSIQTIAGVIQSPVLQFCRDHSISGRQMLVQTGAFGGAGVIFSGNWYYSPETQELTIRINVGSTFQMFGVNANVGVQQFSWSLRVTGGSPHLINIVDVQGNQWVMELVAKSPVRRWVPHIKHAGAIFATLPVIFVLFRVILPLVVLWIVFGLMLAM